MTAAAAPSNVSQPLRDPLSRILMAGLAGGAVDFVYPTVMALSKGRSALSPWHGVASGWLGPTARDGGLATAALGVVTHFVVATLMAAAYVLLARRVPVVAQRPWATAPVYGLILYAIMYLGVLPARWPGVYPRWDGATSVLDILAHIGVALAIVAVVTRPRPQ